MTDSVTQRKRIADLEAFMVSEVFQVWQASRTAEVQLYDEAAARYAKSWDEVLEARARRDNTLELQNSFEETCGTLKTELDAIVEAEAQAATNTKV